MPIYEFKCKECGKEFEFLCLSSKDENAARCPACGSEATERLLSTFSSVSSGNGGALGSVASSACSSSGGFS